MHTCTHSLRPTQVTATTVPIDDEDIIFHPRPVNETTCTYLRVCARLLQLGGGEPMMSTLHGLIDFEELNISLTKNISVAFWELHEEVKSHSVGLAYGQLYDADDFPAQLERGEIDLEYAAEMYMIREADADTILGIPLQRDKEGRFVWESRVAATGLPLKMIPPDMPAEGNLAARRQWKAEQWKQTVGRAALEEYPDPSWLPPPPPPDPDRTPPPQPPPIPPSPPPGLPPPTDVIAASEVALVSHDYLLAIKQGMADACAADEEEEDEDDGGGPGPMRLRAAAAAGDDGDSRALTAAARLSSRQDEEDDEEEEEELELDDDDDEGEDCDFVIVLMVYAKPLDLEFLVPPQWRPQTTIVEITKNRMELMAEICEVVSNNSEVLDRIAGTDSSDSSGLQPAAGPKKRTAVRGAARSDARLLPPPVLTPSAASASPTPVPVARYTPPPPWWSPEATAGWHGWDATGAALQRALRTTRQRVAAPWWDPTSARSGSGVGGEAAAPVRVHVRVAGYGAGGEAAHAATAEAEAPPGKVGAVQQQQQQQQQQPEPQPEPQPPQPPQPQGALMEAAQRPRPGSREDIPGHLWLSQGSGPEPQMSEARRRQLAVLRP